MKNENENLVTSLKLNKIKDGNIDSLLQLKAVAEKLGFEYSEYDAMDGFVFITFAIKEE
jgi:hypothetical protein